MRGPKVIRIGKMTTDTFNIRSSPILPKKRGYIYIYIFIMQDMCNF